MKETLKSKKGITLIALIITIIVLIILAGISIAVLTGEDGLITKAKQGAQNYQNAAIEEQQALNTIYAQTGTQLAVGSTNNGGTSVNQGVTSGGTGLSAQEHEWLEDLHQAMSGKAVVGIDEVAELLPDTLTYTVGGYSSRAHSIQISNSKIPTLGIYKTVTLSADTTNDKSCTLTTYKKVDGEIVETTTNFSTMTNQDISDCLYISVTTPYKAMRDHDTYVSGSITLTLSK